MRRGALFRSCELIVRSNLHPFTHSEKIGHFEGAARGLPVLMFVSGRWLTMGRMKLSLFRAVVKARFEAATQRASEHKIQPPRTMCCDFSARGRRNFNESE